MAPYGAIWGHGDTIREGRKNIIVRNAAIWFTEVPKNHRMMSLGGDDESFLGGLKLQWGWPVKWIWGKAAGSWGYSREENQLVVSAFSSESKIEIWPMKRGFNVKMMLTDNFGLPWVTPVYHLKRFVTSNRGCFGNGKSTISPPREMLFHFWPSLHLKIFDGEMQTIQRSQKVWFKITKYVKYD